MKQLRHHAWIVITEKAAATCVVSGTVAKR